MSLLTKQQADMHALQHTMLRNTMKLRLLTSDLYKYCLIKQSSVTFVLVETYSRWLGGILFAPPLL